MSRTRRLAARCLLPLVLAVPAATAQADVDADALTARFAAMNGTDWTGADASWSVRLPDGRTAWLFGDTFIGGVDSAGRRDPATPVVRNSVVVQGRHGEMRTLTGHEAAGPDALVPGSGPDDWYWPGPPVVGHGLLQIPMAHIVRTGTGDWDVKAIGTALAVFALPDLTLRSLTPVITPPGVNMASAAATSGRFSYIYGTRDAGPYGKDAFVARSPAGDLRAPWTYWNGSSWSPDAASARPVAEGVSNQFSVLRTAGGWTLVSQIPMSRDIVAFSAGAPQGSWSTARRIARVPPIAHAITYNATVHPEFSADDRLVLGFNVNADDFSRVYSDAALYRPRFMEIRLPDHRTARTRTRGRALFT